MKIYIYQHITETGEPKLWPCDHYKSDAEQVQCRIVLIGEVEAECSPIPNDQALEMYKAKFEQAVDDHKELIKKSYEAA